MKGSRFSEEQIIGSCGRPKRERRRPRSAAGTGSRTRPSTSMDGPPWQEGPGPGLAVIDCKHLFGVTT
jgi:hypothetical protein